MAIDYAASPATAERERRAGRTDAFAVLRRLDWVLLGAVGALVAYGLWAIAGITRHDVEGDPDYYVVRQAIFAALGGVGFLAVLLVDPSRLRRHKHALYAATIGLMLLVLIVAADTRGSRRWIDLGPFQFQPSEFGKLLFVLFLAAFLADRAKQITSTGTVLRAVGLAAIPIALVFEQPDFGTALVYAAALVATLFIAGARWLHLSSLVIVGAAFAVALLWALPAAGVEVLKPYQTARLSAFVDRAGDPQETTFHVNQSITAVGAGGLRGRGVEGATQTNLDYLPEHATDFVFASLAEQRGFVGAAFLLCLYLLVLWRGIRIVSIGRDLFASIVAGGIVVALLFQIFVNVGMTMGIAPITGIPLPFVSVGGSSMISNLLAIGILQSIHLRGREHARRP